jgi:hypothetical protein
MASLSRETGIDKADLSRALRLVEEPSLRVLSTLCEFFGVSSATELLAAERERVLLIELKTKLADAAELVGQLHTLRRSCRIGENRDEKPV